LYSFIICLPNAATYYYAAAYHYVVVTAKCCVQPASWSTTWKKPFLLFMCPVLGKHLSWRTIRKLMVY